MSAQRGDQHEKKYPNKAVLGAKEVLLHQVPLVGDGRITILSASGAQLKLISWEFEAINLNTTKPVPVYTESKLAADGVQIELLSGNVANDTLKIRFGSSASNGLIELRAKATMTDTKGKTAVVEHRVWSHGFQSAGSNVDEWVSLLQALAGLQDRSLLISRRPGKRPPVFNVVPNAKDRLANVTTAYMGQTLRDRQLTIEELRNIIGALKKFSTK